MSTHGWPWLLIVVVMFCAPLFINLGGTDLRGDEAAYSFMVDRILEAGDWLVPKASPVEDTPFLEKPPLKAWLTTAPIRAGVLPLDEFSLRIVDAIFGAAAFLYVFGLGVELVGPAAGTIAVLVLFTYTPLLFDHGFRVNTMDSALVLAYAGGVYHFWRWRNADAGDPAVRHAVAVGAYVTLSVMTKFIAVAFLPFVLLAASLLLRAARQRLQQAWRLWVVVALGAVVLSAPWFLYMRWRFGPYFWQVILGQQVLARFTTYIVDPGHVQPWSFYWRTIYSSLFYARSAILVIAGTFILAYEAIRRRWFEGTTLLVWFALPLVALSLGSSKLIHYAHPFILPLALAAGYTGALVLSLAPVPFDRWLTRRPSWLRIALLTLAVAAAALAIDSWLHGEVRWQLTSTLGLRNTGVLRPLLIALLCATVATLRRPGRTMAVLVLLLLLPLPAYATTVRNLRAENHLLRDARDCLLGVQADPARPRGLFVDISPERMQHHYYYYFRQVRPWTRLTSPDFAAVVRELEGPSPVPALVDSRTLQTLPAGVASVRIEEMRLLLPDGYGACAGPTAPTAAER